YFHGGDFEGILKDIPYLKSLGINALWITPPVWNQDFNPDSSLTGYHGYWASHFGKTDPRLGSLTEFRRMSKALKRSGIALVQDVVVNHTGDYFEVDTLGKFRAWNSDKPMQGYLRRWPKDASASPELEVYHRSGAITNYNESVQRLTGQMSGLDDLNTGNPWVQRKLKQDYRRWKRWGSLSGMRFDTPLYVEHGFWKDFLRGMDLYSFGELWTHSPPWSDIGERQAACYLKPGEGMDGALQFPLQKTILEVLDGTRSSAHLSYRLEAEQTHFPLPQQRVHFLDNHDMPRMSSRLDSLQIAQALLLLYSLPGIPVLYYGTESALKGSRDDYFDASRGNASYKEWIQALSELRHREPGLKAGNVEVVLDSRMGTPAWLAWVDRRWLIALNPSQQEIYIPDSLLQAAFSLPTRRASQAVLRCGDPGYWNSDTLLMKPG
ncbi:MAG: alpha-amylase family glycosyl hydrolase, partial [Bacteroidota bacterium]